MSLEIMSVSYFILFVGKIDKHVDHKLIFQRFLISSLFIFFYFQSIINFKTKFFSNPLFSTNIHCISK